jgi:hypothetical protein
VQGENTLANAPALLHAPWLRLIPPAGFVDRGDQVVLAQLAVDAAGAITGLTAGTRRQCGVPTGRLELRVPSATAGLAATVGQTAVAALEAEPGGDVVLRLLGAPAPALRIAAGTGNARLAGSLSVGVDATVTKALSVGGPLSVGGSLAVGPVPSPQARILQVEGTEVHSGGPVGGFSFADRTVGSFVENPNAGQRWVWYSTNGEARLWSSEDMLKVRSPQSLPGSPDGAGLDVLRRMRVRSHDVFSAGIWFHQDRDRGFVGMGDDTHVGFYGADGTGWGLAMNTANGSVGIGIGLSQPAARLHVDGSVAIRAAGHTSVAPGAGGSLFPLPPFLFRGVGVDASGDIGIRSTGRVAAAQFIGNVSISGTLSKGGGGFTIDHPLEPERKYLSHSFVESPEMINLYAGTATTGADGLAWVELPDYFDALNRDVSYQLTAVGRPAQLTIAEEVSGNRFAIRSDPAEATVSWLVTGVRQDRWANANRIVPVVSKPDDTVDRYLHPDVYGVAEDRGIFGAATYDDSTE